MLRIRIRDRVPFYPWIRDPGWVKKSGPPDPDPGWTNPDHISESLETIFWVKILQFFCADPVSGWIKFGSGINIRDPQHCFFNFYFIENLPRKNTWFLTGRACLSHPRRMTFIGRKPTVPAAAAPAPAPSSRWVLRPADSGMRIRLTFMRIRRAFMRIRRTFLRIRRTLMRIRRTLMRIRLTLMRTRIRLLTLMLIHVRRLNFFSEGTTSHEQIRFSFKWI